MISILPKASTFRALWFLLVIYQVQATYRLQERYAWNYIDYAFNDINHKVQAQITRNYIPENNLPVGIEVWNDKMFISVPRWKEGIPATLNYISLTDNNSKSPPLIPYPDWKSNELGNCNTGMNTVYRIKADECNRLWVLDTGTYGIGNTTQQLCPYSINVFNLRTNQRIRRFEIPAELIKEGTFIANTVVDVGKSCDDTFAYFSDELAYGMIVYSWAENRAWRFKHGYFFPDPLAGNFTIDGLTFNWDEEGVFGMSLSPRYVTGEKYLYFSPLASNREFAVSTNVLRNSSKVDDSYNDFIALENRAPNSHTTARVMDDYGVQLFNLIDQNAIGCWNSLLPYHPKYHCVVDRDDVGLIFPSDVKVDAHRNVWVMSDRMSNFLQAPEGLNYNEVNFRVYMAPMKVLIQGTVCDVGLEGSRSYHVNELFE
uniref:Protein yellow n=1 Tax=Harmonia axyridis TaxID=115357 RepID=A0A7G7YAI7_HARAX|nr:yellow [Harmonia axyridis]